MNPIKTNLLVITLLFTFLYSNSYAQEFKLGKVSLKELEEKICVADTTAPAAILFNKARTFFSYDTKNGFSIVTENTFRIKIYKKEGLKWATYKVPYRIGYENLEDDRVDFTDCHTVNLDNGKVVVTKLKNEGIFKTKVNKFWKEAAIVLPNVKVGSIVEFKYTIQSENIVEFPKFNFQYDIPVNNSEYVTEIPGFFVYKAVAKRSSELKFDSKAERGSLNYALTDGTQRTEYVYYWQAKNTYSAYNIPALKEEPFVDNIDNYRLFVSHELEKTQFYQGPVKDYSTTWEGVAKTIYEDQDFGDELNANDYIAQDVTKILGNVNSQSEKLDIIFKFVQNKMSWNKNKGYRTDKGVRQAYIDGTGNIAEINFILIAMLNYAGIPASPVLLSTLDNGVPLFPSRTIFNYVIASANIHGKQILLDATNKYSTNNILPLQTLNWGGRLLHEDGSSQEIKLEPNFLSKKVTNLMVSVSKNGALSGKCSVFRSDYDAFVFREKYTGVNQQDNLEKIENDLGRIQISDYSVENSSDFAKPILENFSFNSDNHMEVIGDKMYLKPFLFFTPTTNPFTQEKRDFPIYFGYPTQYKFNVHITIPEGYKVESQPTPIKLGTEENVCLFTYNVSSDGKSLQVASTLEINSVVVPASFYETIKNFYKQMIDKQNEKIVLKKI
jgi:Domain of Unknown Function with PDB structure (DUF3857)